MAPWLQALLVAIAGGGIFGAIAALLRVRPEAGTAAVAQSADALLIMKGLNDELAKERNEWRGEALVLRDRVAELERRVEHLERLLRDAAVPMTTTTTQVTTPANGSST